MKRLNVGVALLALVLASCGEKVEQAAEPESLYLTPETNFPAPEISTPLPKTEMGNASLPPASITYPSSPSFHGYDCTEDCSGHEAGYQWAEDNEITSPDDCGGNSNSFIEGCESYAEEHEGEGEE